MSDDCTETRDAINTLRTLLLGANGEPGTLEVISAKLKDHEMRLRKVESMAVKASVIAGGVAAACATLLTFLLGRI
jgi:hypothetical protein